MKKDNLIFGMLIGFIVPILVFTIYYFWVFYRQNAGFMEFLWYLKHYYTVLTFVSTIALFVNVAIFTLYINSQLDKTAKGIFAATLICAIVVLLTKLVR